MAEDGRCALCQRRNRRTRTVGAFPPPYAQFAASTLRPGGYEKIAADDASPPQPPGNRYFRRLLDPDRPGPSWGPRPLATKRQRTGVNAALAPIGFRYGEQADAMVPVAGCGIPEFATISRRLASRRGIVSWDMQ